MEYVGRTGPLRSGNPPCGSAKNLNYYRRTPWKTELLLPVPAKIPAKWPHCPPQLWLPAPVKTAARWPRFLRTLPANNPPAPIIRRPSGRPFLCPPKKSGLVRKRPHFSPLLRTASAAGLSVSGTRACLRYCTASPAVVVYCTCATGTAAAQHDSFTAA